MYVNNSNQSVMTDLSLSATLSTLDDITSEQRRSRRDVNKRRRARVVIAASGDGSDTGRDVSGAGFRSGGIVRQGR